VHRNPGRKEDRPRKFRLNNDEDHLCNRLPHNELLMHQFVVGWLAMKNQLDVAAVLLAFSLTIVLTKSSPALYEDRTCKAIHQ
jgi:hypothetical protein